MLGLAVNCEFTIFHKKSLPGGNSFAEIRASGKIRSIATIN